MNPKKDPKRNASDYIDMTAYKAIEKADREIEAELRYKKIIKYDLLYL